MAVPPDALRDHFLGWQCRIRQIAMRQHGGRPTTGMRPRVVAISGEEIAPAVTVLLVPRSPAESTAFFRDLVRKSADPRAVYERGLEFLRADYFQRPGDFSDRLVAVFPMDSPVAAKLAAEAGCVLEFKQFRQRYRLPSAVHDLAADEGEREAAIWHNRLFNPSLPGAVHVLAFDPDWTAAEADPAPAA